MIIEMKKITVLGLAQEREQMVHRLHELGVVHLSHQQPPEGKDLNEAWDELKKLQRAISILQSTDNTPRSEAGANLTETRMAELVEHIAGLEQELQAQEEAFTACTSEVERLRPFGHFDRTPVSALNQYGMELKLFVMDARYHILPPSGDIDANKVLQQLKTQGVEIKLKSAGGKLPLIPPPQCLPFVLHVTNGKQYVAVIGPAGFSFPAEAFHPGERPLAELEKDLQDMRQNKDRIQRQLNKLAPFLSALKTSEQTRLEHIQVLEAREGMGSANQIAYLQGFCPADQIRGLREQAGHQQWGLLIKDPAPEEDVPTLIRNPDWVKPVRPLFDFLGIVPGYHEVDVSSAFLVFMTIFFAMIVGDAGYGVLLLALTRFFRKRQPQAPAQPFTLLTLFSSATLVWGVLSGNYFGILPERLPGVLTWLRIDRLMDQDHNMTFCLMLGAVHLTVAHAWNAIRFGKSMKTLAQAGWICMVWVMLALSRYLLISPVLPVWFWPAAVVGTAAVVSSLIARKDWMGFSNLPQDIISNFGDLVSYLRLFALGIASVQVARAFNQMAGMIGFDGPGRLAGALLVLFFGHGLNILLCAMSVLVHGVRLNALEFSMHIGQEWAGFPYAPFRKTTPAQASSGAATT